MEQGRISEILKATPEYRRAILDEAAGVARYKAERKETLDRLHDTEQNLLRLGDILKSKRDEIEHLERQARKTRRYIELKENLDEHDLNVRFLNLGGQREKATKAEERLARMLEKRDASLEAVKAAEAGVSRLEQEARNKMEEMHLLDRAFHQDLSSLESMAAAIERISVDHKDRVEKVTGLERRWKEEEKARRELEKKYQESLQLELNLKADIESLKRDNEKLEEAMQLLRKDIRQTIEQEEQNQNAIAGGEADQAGLLIDLKNVTHDLILELERKKRELESREGYRRELKGAITEKLLSGADELGEARAMLKSGDAAAAGRLLGKINLEGIIEDFQRYESIEQEFRSLLFDKSGLLAKKEELDRKMSEITERKHNLQQENEALLKKRRKFLDELDQHKNRKVELDLQVRDFEVRRESSQEVREDLQQQLEATTKRYNFYAEQIDAFRSEMERLRKEEGELKEKSSEVRKRTHQQSGNIETLKKAIDALRGQAEKERNRVRSEQERFESLLPEISQQERNAEQARVNLSSLEEELYTDFQMSPGELEESRAGRRLKRDREENAVRQLQAEIRELGAFNALAIEELERSQEAYDELEKQKTDIENARQNILGILKDIEIKSQEMFKDTFERIQVNFAEIFQTLFGGGRASLSLTEPDDTMNSGVDIMVQPPGKKNSSIALLSGGEQSMTAIALMFAIYLVRPSPFCFLDEIDAPLDDNNVLRFLKMLHRVTPRTQFMVITHNKLTMARASAIFGVTQEEAGVSKLVSVRLKERELTAKDG